jgi:Uma2 family endonuclease
MTIIQDPPDQRVILNNISWDLYERMLAEFADSSTPRLAYDRGTLEIMSPLQEHEEWNRSIATLVEIIAVSWGLRIRNLGSTTFKRADLARGFEPDSSFYIQNAGQIRGKSQVDLTVDPPPDLVIEIDLTHSSLDKLPIYARLRIPEVWRYNGARATILALESGSYQECSESIALPGLTAVTLTDLIEDSKSMERHDWWQRVQDWARKQRGPDALAAP